MTNTTQSRSNTIVTIITIIIITLLTLVFCEWSSGFIVRYYKSVRWHDEYVKLIGQWGSQDDWGEYGDLPPDMDRIRANSRRRTWLTETNDVGFRNIEDIDWSEDTQRILVLGDSMTYGGYLSNEDTWAAWLEQLLRKKYGSNIQVLNGGVPAYTTEDMFEYLQDKALHVKPSLVIYGMLPEDVTDYLPRYREGYSRSYKRMAHEKWPLVTEFPKNQASIDSFQDYLRQFNLYILGSIVKQTMQESLTLPTNEIALITENQTETEPTNNDKKSEEEDIFDILSNQPDHPVWQEFEQDLVQLIELLESENIPLLIVGIPNFRQMPPINQRLHTHDIVRDIAEQHEVAFVDLLPFFVENGGVIESIYLFNYDTINPPDRKTIERRGETYYGYIGNGHFSRYGTLLVAQRTMQVIEENNLLLLPPK